MARVSAHIHYIGLTFSTFLLGFLHFTKLSISSNRHLRKNKGTGAEMCPTIVSGMVTGDAPVCYWLIFSMSVVTLPEFFAKGNSSPFPSCFLSGDIREL